MRYSHSRSVLRVMSHHLFSQHDYCPMRAHSARVRVTGQPGTLRKESLGLKSVVCNFRWVRLKSSG